VCTVKHVCNVKPHKETLTKSCLRLLWYSSVVWVRVLHVRVCWWWWWCSGYDNACWRMLTYTDVCWRMCCCSGYDNESVAVTALCMTFFFWYNIYVCFYMRMYVCIYIHTCIHIIYMCNVLTSATKTGAGRYVTTIRGGSVSLLASRTSTWCA
jgi:hypothetical protein